MTVRGVLSGVQSETELSETKERDEDERRRFTGIGQMVVRERDHVLALQRWEKKAGCELLHSTTLLLGEKGLLLRLICLEYLPAAEPHDSTYTLSLLFPRLFREDRSPRGPLASYKVCRLALLTFRYTARWRPREEVASSPKQKEGGRSN